MAAQPKAEPEPAAVGQRVLDLLRVDVQPLRELGRELVADLRADLVERVVELVGRHAERGRELLSDVVTGAAAVAIAAEAALRAQVLKGGADLRGVDAGRRRDVVPDRVEVAAPAAAPAAEVLPGLVEAGLHLRGVDAERLGEVGGELASDAVTVRPVRQDRVERGGHLVDGLAQRGRERLRQLGAPLVGRLRVADRDERAPPGGLADAELRGQVVEAGAAAAEAGAARTTTIGGDRGRGAGGRGVRARGERAAVAGLRPERVGARGEHDPYAEKDGELLRSRVHGEPGCPATLRAA